jgi:ABC-type branched-subunit amino acid transport system substrate-binding protein
MHRRTEPPQEVAQADGVFFGGVARPASAEVLHNVRALAPDALLFGTDGLLDRDFAATAPEGLCVSSVPPPSPKLMARLGKGIDVHAAFAYEAMSLLLDALAAVGPDRAALVATMRATTDRHSPVGRYGFDEHGASTLGAIGRLRSTGGRFMPSP